MNTNSINCINNFLINIIKVNIYIERFIHINKKGVQVVTIPLDLNKYLKIINQIISQIKELIHIIRISIIIIIYLKF